MPKRRVRGPVKDTQYLPAKVVAQKALSSVRKLGRRVGAPEIMFFDTDTSSSFTSSGATTSLSGIAQGDDVNTRDGNQITAKRLIFRGLLRINASANDTSVRLIIAADRECVGSNPAVSDVLASAEVTGMYEMKNNKGRFFTAVFAKKDGTTRTINCQYRKGQPASEFGYIQVNESGLLKTDPTKAIRQINMQTLKSLTIAGTRYVLNS